MPKREPHRKINLDGRNLGTLHVTGAPMMEREEWLDIYEHIVDAAVADARSGRFHRLADELRLCGDPHIDGKRAGSTRRSSHGSMKVAPLRGAAATLDATPKLEDSVYFYYDHARSEYDTNDLPEKNLLLWIVERLSNHHLDFERVRNIVRKKAQQDADKHYPNATSKQHAVTPLKKHLKEFRLDEKMHRQRFAAIIEAQREKQRKAGS